MKKKIFFYDLSVLKKKMERARVKGPSNKGLLKMVEPSVGE